MSKLRIAPPPKTRGRRKVKGIAPFKQVGETPIDLKTRLGISKGTLAAEASVRPNEQPKFEDIRDGDLVLLDREATPHTGDIVATEGKGGLVFEYYDPLKPVYAVATHVIHPLRKGARK